MSDEYIEENGEPEVEGYSWEIDTNDVFMLGIAYSAVGAITFEVGGVTVALSGLAVGSVVGILLNIILPGKEEGWDGGLAAEAEADDVPLPLPLEAEVTSLPIAD